MEAVVDWVIKVAFRLPLMRDWMQAHQDLWGHLIEWFKDNNEPPQQHARNANGIQVNKPQNLAISNQRYYYPYRNRAQAFYRRHCLIQIKQGQGPDLINEFDIDYYHLDDFKLQKDQKVMFLEDRHLQQFYPATIATDMDELVFLRVHNKEQQTQWEATDKGRVFIEGIWDTSHKAAEM